MIIYFNRISNYRRNVLSSFNPLIRLKHQSIPTQDLIQENLSDSDLILDSDQLASNILPRRRSDASQYGSTRLPIVQLPKNLIAGVQELVQSVDHRSTIRTSALGLYGKYRITSSKKSLSKSNHDLLDSFLSDPQVQLDKNKVKPKLSTTYDHLTSISFAAGAMPSHYGATFKVLLELKRRLNSDQFRRNSTIEWTPKSLLDYGSGTGSAIWSALQVWPDSLKNYTALDKSRSMIWLNQKLLENRSHDQTLSNSINLKHSNLNTTFKTITISPTEAQKLIQHPISENLLLDQLEDIETKDSSSLEIDLKPPKEDWIQESDGLLAIMSFTLSDLPNQASRRQAIEGMWNSGAETLVVIDRGTPAGFQVVAEARQQLLMLGRRSINNSTLKIDESNLENLDVSHHTKNDEIKNETTDSNSIGITNQTDRIGSWVLAPCPHDKPCPLHVSNNPKHFCHFSQRIERPQFLKLTKHTSKQEEDSKYSYMIIRRGSRVPSTCSLVSSLDSSTSSSDQSRDDDQENNEFSKGDAIDWPRIILPPLKRKGHVVFDVCTMSGQIERMTIPRSQGKQAYYDARKTFWGDLWPHGSKKPGLIKTLKGRNGNRGDRRRKKKEFNST